LWEIFGITPPLALILHRRHPTPDIAHHPTPAAPRWTSPPIAIAPMSTVTTHSTLTSSHSGSTQQHTATSSSSSSFLDPVGAPIIDGTGGPVASLEARVAIFKRCAAQAMAAADEAAADAARINNAHAEIVNQHRKLFLAKAFCINPDGTNITNPSAFLVVEDPPSYNSVKSVEHYNEIVHCLTNWGGDRKDLPPNDLEAQRIKAFRTKNKKGYNYN
jgi:hypothetical protein